MPDPDRLAFARLGTDRGEVDALAGRVLDAHDRGDYEALARDAAPELLERVPRERFLEAHERVHRPLGRREATRFVGTYETAGGLAVLHAARYAGGDGELLLSLTLRRHGDALRVVSIWAA